MGGWGGRLGRLKEAARAGLTLFIIADIAYCFHQCHQMYTKRCQKWNEEDFEEVMAWAGGFFSRVSRRCTSDPRSQWPRDLWAVEAPLLAAAPAPVGTVATWDSDDMFQLIWGEGPGPGPGQGPEADSSAAGVAGPPIPRKKARVANDYIDLEELTHLHLPDGSSVVYPPAWALLRASQALESAYNEGRARALRTFALARTLPARTRRISGLRFRVCEGRGLPDVYPADRSSW